jgi:hypothetical protein
MPSLLSMQDQSGESDRPYHVNSNLMIERVVGLAWLGLSDIKAIVFHLRTSPTRSGCIFRFPLGLRLIEEMLLEWGVLIPYETVRRRVLKFGPHYARRCKCKAPSRHDI